MRCAATSFFAALGFAGAALGCEPADLGPDAQRVETASHVLAFRVVPAPLPLNARFAVDMALCAKNGAAASLAKIDAWMPAHRHGMNYRPVLSAAGPGRWRADGLLFHMPGTWEFVFEAGGERLTAARDVR